MRQFEQQLDLTGVLPEERKPISAATFMAYLLEQTDENLGEMDEDGGFCRPAIIICPGGGYEHHSVREGDPVARKYLSMGYHVFLLHYSLAPDRFPAALLELAMLLGRIRTQAKEWRVDRDKIIVSGFSAGGHLAGCLGVFWNREFVWKALDVTSDLIRPNGLLLGYPVITSGEGCHEGSFEALLGKDKEDPEKRGLVSLELQVGPHVPETFIWHTVTDQSVPVTNSILFAEALIRNHVRTELHLFPQGCHGLALAAEESALGDERYVEPGCRSWVSLAEIWLKGIQ